MHPDLAAAIKLSRNNKFQSHVVVSRTEPEPPVIVREVLNQQFPLQLPTPLTREELLLARIDDLEKHIDDLEKRIRDLESPPPPKKINLQMIIDLVCESYHVAEVDLLSLRRTKEMIWPRFIVCYLARVLTGVTFPTLGRRMGRDHTTMVSAYDRARKRRQSDADFDRELNRLTKILNAIINGEQNANEPTLPQLDR